MSMSTDTTLPSVALQGLKAILSPAELRQARLVCKEWATELVTAVHSVTLAPPLWQQQANPRGLQRLLATYSTFKRAKLLADSQQDPDAAAVVAAARLLQAVPALETVVVSNLGGSSAGWSAVLGGLSALGSRVTTLELRDVRLPGPDGLDALAGLPSIRSLVLVPAGGSKLQQQHVEAISKMPLKRLRLAFRAMAGTRFEPVTLDCLGRPGSGLTHLEVRYTGMAELASGVCFAAEDCLPGCSSLQSLVLSRVPTPSLRGLFRLSQLTRLSVTQLSPLSETQARSVSLCTQLQQLDLNNLPLELLPRLAELLALTSLQVSLWVPPAAAGQDLPGGHNIVSLAALSRLESFSLRGPVMLAASDAATLAAGWQQLRALKLEVTLLDGVEGLALFTALDSLAIAPWVGSGSRVAGMAGLGGPEEGPMPDWSGNELALQWTDLPHSLRVFDGRQVTFAAPGQQQLMAAGPGAAPAGPQQLAALKLHFSPDSRASSLQLPLDALAGLTSIDVKHPALQAQQLADLLAACCSSLASLRLDTSSNVSVLNKPLRAVKHTPAALADDLAAWAAASSAIAGPGSNCGGNTKTATATGSGSGSISGWSSRVPSFSSFSAAAGSSSGSSSSFYTAAAAGAAAVAVAAAAATAAGSGVAVATAAAATAGAATAGALSRSGSFSLGGRSSGGGVRPSSASAAAGNGNSNNANANSSSSMSMLESLSSASFTLQSMSSASLASMLGDALWVGSSAAAAAAAGLGGMGAGLADGPGLACIGQCSKLTELHVVVGERALSSKARAAIAALTGLRRLSLAVAADAPGAVARDLGSWVGRLRGLESVAFAVEGPGSSAVQLELCDRAAALLPACQVLSLKTTGR